MEVKIDLNSDLGEHPDSTLDEQIMPFISSCNIACGGHAGDEDSVKKTIELAIENGVAIGAHPSFPDRENFGREILTMDNDQLSKSLKEQVLLVKALTERAGKKLHHVKPHGALYNLAAVDKETSRLISELILDIDPEIRLFGLANSVSEEVARELGVKFIGEAFADRRYEPDMTLRSRKLEDAVIHDVNEVLKQVEEIALNGRVYSNEKLLKVSAETICLHSDTKGAVNLAKSIHDHLVKKGTTIAAI